MIDFTKLKGGDRDIVGLAEAAVKRLVDVRPSQDGAIVGLPIFYPSGAGVALTVRASGNGFIVSDTGLAFREVELFGGDRAFSKTALSAAQEAGIEVSGRQLIAHVPEASLSSALAEVGSASAQVAHRISEKLAGKGEAQIASALYERLVRVFGFSHVEPQATLVGPSTKEWRVDALVRFGVKRTIFQAVTPHWASVYSTSAMFRDLALFDLPVEGVAVVRDRNAFGPLFNILSQAGNIIDEGQPDNVFKRVAQEHLAH